MNMCGGHASTPTTYIEKFVRKCESCQLTQNSLSKTPLSKWAESTIFFERIHIDFFYFRKEIFLIGADTYLQWFDVKHMKSTISAKLIEELRISGVSPTPL